MAQRRMFAKTIIDSDAFLDMPLSSQVLYFHLSMRADDEGFVNNPKSIMRNVRCNEDDMRLLIMKKFIIGFESGVVVIKHWRIHNYIQNDRFTPTKYKEEKSQLAFDENKAYTQCIQDVSMLDTQDRLGKDSIDIQQQEYINNARARLIDSFSQELCRPITPMEMQLLIDWEKLYSTDLVIFALKEAVANNKRNFRYIETILISWKAKGIKTVIQAQEAINEFNHRKEIINSSDSTADELMKKDVSELEKKKLRMVDLKTLMDIYSEDEAKYSKYLNEYEKLAKEVENYD